jgi:hypothetical protein
VKEVKKPRDGQHLHGRPPRGAAAAAHDIEARKIGDAAVSLQLVPCRDNVAVVERERVVLPLPLPRPRPRLAPVPSHLLLLLPPPPPLLLPLRLLLLLS